MGSSTQEACYLALLALAEEFRTMNPPNIRNCIQCLCAIFNLKQPPKIEARTHLQLGNILLQHTKNTDLAQSHLEKAWYLSQNLAGFDDVKFEAASVLADLYEKKNQMHMAKSMVGKAVEISQQSPFWHSRLLFQLAHFHASEKEYAAACSVLGVGAEFAHISGAQYTRILFLLSKGMLLMIDRKLQEVHQVLTLAGQLVEAWQGSTAQKEALKVFFLVLQVCHYLTAGQVKSVKPCLKQLQQGIQTITSLHADEEVIPTNPGDMFQWMPKEHMCVLVYLVTVLHSMQAGYMDKAQKYTDKALMQIEKLKMIDSHPILHSFQLLLLEHIAMCRLVMGNKTLAIQEASHALQICKQEPRLFVRHRPQINALLGLYAMSMNCMEAAEAQFGTVVRSNATSELRILASLNLAIVYLRSKRDHELVELLSRLNPETLPLVSHSLRAAAYYVHGLNAFFQARYNDAKRYLRETLKMANAEDLNRLTSCSLVLLGHIFFSLGNSRESMNMVTPAMQLASKIPDVHVQLWASALLKDLYRLTGDMLREQEAIQTHSNFSQLLLKDHFQASQLPEHSLIQWIEGDPPLLPVQPQTPATSLL
ncbi:MAU2 chromatid cohesion factor homolog [Argiope bruennichi]|uniref:MAU2 chromatid cohesion factor homolog n=1 Tax=Argiope bruennichi TaxID=94029 RepID=A0A8T0F7J4_ARGBR|nr:MAU2 chromatid cohesion factor homolog [Argiope bruennichi]KAF8786298.1 MAU2 chromatid cohesion factor like protein [Argiope bruennichi]